MHLLSLLSALVLILVTFLSYRKDVVLQYELVLTSLLHSDVYNNCTVETTLRIMSGLKENFFFGKFNIFSDNQGIFGLFFEGLFSPILDQKNTLKMLHVVS